MDSQLINFRINELRKEKGLTLQDVEKATGISSSSLSTYENDPDIFIPHSAIVSLAQFYDVSADYLLGLSELRKTRNEGLNDLKISDDTVELLKGGKINNSLLCEFLTDPAFIKLLTDLEIYADGLASIPLQVINPFVDAIREMMIKSENGLKSDTPADERILQMLNTAHIEMDDYFFNILHKDLDAIAASIREKHKNDPDAAPDTLIGEATTDAFERVKDILSKTGNIQESLDKLMLEQFTTELGIRPEDLPQNKKAVLLEIFHDSKKYKKELRHTKKIVGKIR